MTPGMDVYTGEEDRPERSDEFLISREALDEAHSALAGSIAVCGDVANLSHAMKLLKTARGTLGDLYNGH